MSQPGDTCGHHSPASSGPVATRPAGWDEALELRFEHGPLRDHALRHVAPERHEQLASQGHNGDPAHAAARRADPLDEALNFVATGDFFWINA